MPTTIALLRGINVGGKNILKMERLRALCSKLGFKNVQTYVQSGNVVFEASESPAACAKAIEKTLAGETPLPVTVIVRTAAEMKRIIADNPFLREKEIDRSRLAVTFLSAAASTDGLKKLNEVRAGPDRFKALGKDLYLNCPTGFARTKLSHATVERMLAVKATTRNWNTVNRLYEMTSQ